MIGKHLTEELHAIHQDVMQGMDRIKTRVNEQIFVSQFLPLIHGGATDATVNLDPWFSLVGGIFNTAYVIDNSGAVLFETPPLYPTNEFITQGDLRALILDADKASHARTNAHQENLDRYFGEKGGLKIHDPAAVFQNWNVIFKRYGFSERTSDILNIGTKEITPQTTGGVSELFDYD